MKTCIKCGIEKDESCFHRQKAGKGGLRSCCKECRHAERISPEVKARSRDAQKARRATPEGRATKRRNAKKYRATAKAKEATNKAQKARRATPDGKARSHEYRKKYDATPIGKAGRSRRNKRCRAKPEYREYQKEYQKTHRLVPEVQATTKIYLKKKNALPEVRAARNEHTKMRRNTDPLYKLRQNLRVLIGHYMKKAGYSKKSKTHQLLGADFETVKKHLENTWFQNYGIPYSGQEVHIDHIIPCASAKTEEELIALQHYTNLQYLTPEDNLAKSNKMPAELPTQSNEVK